MVKDEHGPDYVSRGAHKLGLWPPSRLAGSRWPGAGASDARRIDPGGFTDVLLRAGAAEVVDVGYGQFDWSLQQDPRVGWDCTTGKRPHALTPDLIGGPVDLVVGDLSFISLALVLDALLGVTRRTATWP